MIRREMLAQAYDAGLIRIVDSPNGDGAVCAIGEHWFYFGGLTAEEHSAVEYVGLVPKEDILREIFDVLEDFRREAGDFGNEYMYYEAYIQENCPASKGKDDATEHADKVEPYILEFLFVSEGAEPDTSMLVALDQPLSEDQVAEIEDSILSYIDDVPVWSFEKLVSDVLAAAGCKYTLLRPAHTYRI